MEKNLENRTLIATMIMQSFISLGDKSGSLITLYPNDLSEKRQLKEIEHFTELSFKIADTILKKSNDITTGKN
jgi:hypothetical protein